MSTGKNIDAGQVVKKINIIISEIKQGVTSSSLSFDDIRDVQKDLIEIKAFALKLKEKFK